MTCPICDQKPMNCDCTPEERRMHAEIERLRSQPCPYVIGNVTRHCTLTPLTLTDDEREAIEYAATTLSVQQRRSTLRGLLERTK